jgi:hypothetical protein
MAYGIFFEVEYVTNVFDLTAPQTTFEFIFQLYNFISEAKAGNDGLHEPERRLLEAKTSVARKGYASFSRLMREETSSNRSSGPSTREDSFGNQSVQIVLTRAGYILTQPIPEGLTPLFPVSRNSRRCTR